MRVCSNEVETYSSANFVLAIPYSFVLFASSCHLFFSAFRSPAHRYSCASLENLHLRFSNVSQKCSTNSRVSRYYHSTSVAACTICMLASGSANEVHPLLPVFALSLTSSLDGPL
ncbi:hypothetical protein BD311DRAFT_442429 [Dichomitus squalens]|uniref:Uncharacterized protein n=1 Tax=Dichomitus squalens TaxID=114155 RepID=A0A4Q9N188_9APHY|nr:hypothetical protein BD311DRAFT_442429 [Dichomitus squalens]